MSDRIGNFDIFGWELQNLKKYKEYLLLFDRAFILACLTFYIFSLGILFFKINVPFYFMALFMKFTFQNQSPVDSCGIVYKVYFSTFKVQLYFMLVFVTYFSTL